MLRIAGLTLVVLLFLFSSCDGKGSFGYQRSSAGGYFRSTKSGYYSQRTRYYTSGMYWSGSGYSNRNEGYRGAPARTEQGKLSSAAVEDVLCKRQVVVDSAATSAGSITFNSTQNCVKELYAIPGDPGNKPIEDLMLDRIQFKFRLAPYPTIDMKVFPDKDVIVPVLNTSFRLRKLFLSSSPTASTGTTDIDLGQINWHPCTLNSCDESKSNEFGNPSSRFLDGGRVVTMAVSGTTSSGIRILLRFWLSNDFDEDGIFSHVFLLPSAVKMDISAVVVDQTAFNFAFGSRELYLGVDAILSNPASGPSSNVVPIPVQSSMSAIEYNPRKMSRVEIGGFQAQKDKKGGLLSWWSSSSNDELCFDKGDDSCVNFLDWSNSTIGIICPQGATTPSYCADLLHPGFVGRSLRWVFQKPLTSTSDFNWYVDFGYWDPYQGEAPSNAVSSSVLISLLLIWGLCL